MKTVEQAAQECEFDGELVSNRHIFNQGFTSGVEFAQRWISVEDELPERKEPESFYSDEVLTKCEKGFYWLQQYDYTESDWTDCPKWTKITHWRPIEYK